MSLEQIQVRIVYNKNLEGVNGTKPANQSKMKPLDFYGKFISRGTSSQVRISCLILCVGSRYGESGSNPEMICLKGLCFSNRWTALQVKPSAENLVTLWGRSTICLGGKMDSLTTSLVIVILLFLLYLLLRARRMTIFEFERGILFKRGKYQRTLEPGAHWYLTPIHAIQKMDMRSRIIPIPGQEVLSSDNIGIRISLTGTYKIDDPVKATVEVIDYQQATYLELQVNLRDIVGAIPIDEFLSKRQDIGNQIFERSKDNLSKFGILLEAVSIKDIMFPGDLKQIFAQVVNARNEGLAALERARGESAALRNLANSASVLEKNPGLLQLRTLQAIERSPGNIILSGEFFEMAAQAKIAGKSNRKE